VLCDNSRSTETIPRPERLQPLRRPLPARQPGLRAGSLAGTGPHRHACGAGGATVTVTARLFNPTALGDSLRIETRVLDPAGKVVDSSEKSLAPWTGTRPIASFAVPTPALWSKESQSVHLRRHSEEPHGEHRVEELFGLRYFEFPKHGVFHLNGEKLFLRGTQRHEDHAGLAPL